MKKIFLSGILILVQIIGISQVKTGAVIFFNEKNQVIYLDNNKISSSKLSVKLEPGWHKIKAWAPHYQLMDDSFMVKNDKLTFFSKHLKETEGYITYKRDSRKYNTIKLLPLLFTAASGVTFWLIDKSYQKKIDDYSAQAADFRSQHTQAITADEFEHIEENYAATVSNYEKTVKTQQSLRTTGTIVTCVGAAVIVTSIIYLITHKKPKYEEKQLLSRLKLNYMYSQKTNYICVKFSL